ncbi:MULTISPECIES: oligosaccharide repeat unit polymerase [unclassified Serratia (in: enterobacteria)]|uniref:oligosaccharide repeat unit polymerase n=1 Tax=unclassified Serratia (in: enterobacteria) TaxID=2647522 RepID=UPI00050429FE|nr:MULTISPECIES: oligosaccharide repeat unit polymerase [unclassified Serratia (in: enterobacteria)]KFK97882.1 hypothetical protein JV45_00885 [Serratia sp. Ag2]KFL00273.1 hypothetical protein IV04_02195 [Serratia sp. Ag1]
MTSFDKAIVGVVKKHLSFIYITANIVCAILFSINGYLGGDFSGTVISNPDNLFFSLLLVIFFIFIYQFAVFSLINRVNIPSVSYEYRGVLDITALVLSFLGIYGAIVYDIGIVGVGADRNANSIMIKLISYVISIFQPVWFCLIYIYYRVCVGYNKLFIINILAYTVLILATGQTVQFIALIYVYMYIYFRRKHVFPLSRLISLSIVGVLLYPFFRFLKYSIIASSAYNVEVGIMMQNAISEKSLYDLYADMFFVGLERFQVVANTEYLLTNISSISSNYTPSISSFLSGFWLFDSIYKMLGYSIATIPTPQVYLATMINGMDNWASHIGLYGYMVFFGSNAIFVYIISILMIITSVVISKFLIKSPFFILISWISSFILIVHGWVIQYMSFLQALIIFAFFIVFCQFFIKKYR